MLLKDVLWYNFEIVCSGWQRPWFETVKESQVELRAHRYKHYWNRGTLWEQGDFPVYYRGPVEDAPNVPPQIIVKELKEARAYLALCERQRTAVDDWAPGGPLYDELARNTRVGKKTVHNPVYSGRKRTFSSA